MLCSFPASFGVGWYLFNLGALRLKKWMIDDSATLARKSMKVDDRLLDSVASGTGAVFFPCRPWTFSLKRCRVPGVWNRIGRNPPSSNTRRTAIGCPFFGSQLHPPCEKTLWLIETQVTFLKPSYGAKGGARNEYPRERSENSLPVVTPPRVRC